MNLAVLTLGRSDFVKTSLFGWRTHPITKVRHFHQGIDYWTFKQNWPVYAFEDGVILASNSDATNGNYVWIAYPRIDIKIFLAHLDQRFVSKGDQVQAGTSLGTVGNTGSSTAMHLHMGVKLISTDKYFDHDTYVYVPPVVVVEPPVVVDETPIKPKKRGGWDKTRSMFKL